MSLSRSTILLVFLALASALLGFGRECYIAYMFGATNLTDSFYVATIVPDMIAGWLSYALTNALVPVLKEEISVSEDSAKRLLSTVCWFSLAVLVLIVVAAYAAQTQIIGILAPGFRINERFLATQLLGIMLPSMVASGLSGVLWGIHNAYESFSYPALTGVVYNVLLIATALILSDFTGVKSLAYAFDIGVCGRLAVQLLPLLRSRTLGFPRFWHASLPKMFRLLPPIIFSNGISYLNLIVDRYLASSLPSGQISNLNYASKVGLIPVALIGTSFATTLYSRFISYRLKNKVDELYDIFVRGCSAILFLSMITTSFYVLFAQQIITVLFQHGSYTANDSTQASIPLIVFGLFQVWYNLPPVLMHFQYAGKRNRQVLGTSMWSVLTNIVLSFLLIPGLGMVGLALSNAVSQMLYVIVSCMFISRDMKWSLTRIIKDVGITGILPGVPIFLCMGVYVIVVKMSNFWLPSLIDLTCAVCSCVLGILVSLLVMPNNDFNVRIKDIIKQLCKTVSGHLLKRT